MSPIGISTLVKVLESGIEIFAQDGPFAAGTAEIAKKAAVAESTIFRRFDTKENLFHQCFHTVMSRSLDPSQFRSLLFEKADEKRGFAHAVTTAVKRWYASMPVAAARLVLFTTLSSSSQLRIMGSQQINQIIAILAERVLVEGSKRRTRDLDANAAAASLISSLLYLKSTSGKERDQRTAETFIRQWIFGLFPE